MENDIINTIKTKLYELEEKSRFYKLKRFEKNLMKKLKKTKKNLKIISEKKTKIFIEKKN